MSTKKTTNPIATKPATQRISDTVTFQPMKSTMESAIESMNAKVAVNDSDDGISYSVSLATPTKDGRTNVTVYDSTIAAKIALIQGYTTVSDRTELIKCGFLSSLSDEDLKKCGNFTSISDFGKSVFGWDRVSTLVYSRVGKFFVTKNETEDGFSFWSYLPTSYGKSHLQEILAAFDFDNESLTVEAVRKQVAEWLQNGTLTDNMSTSAIRKVMSSLRGMVDEDGNKLYPLLKENKTKKNTEKTDKGGESI